MEQKKIALTVQEASEYTGIGRNNLRSLLAWEKIPSIRVGKKILIRIEVLEQFMRLNDGKKKKKKQEVIAVWKRE